jgi:hypothetical protein
MLRQDPESVLHDPNLPGDWVLWERVGDPADEGPGRRVYALDEASGVVRFGDGLHGAIPPTGRDSIVAFSYQRTEPPIPGSLDVPANAVEARTKINLVTPVLGAEAAFSADRAAGGAPPDSVDHVLRFATSRLRHRGRALTARDLEDLALQSSPSIVQARALDAGGRVRLVVVLRGRQPTPGEAQKRELERLLLDAAPPFLSSGRLEIRGPRLRPLRISLRLRVASLDSAGSVADEVRRRLQSLFDTATGGASGLGWPLGATPREEDLVLAMLDVPGLSGISDVEWSELRDGEPQPWPASLAPHELAWLASDGIRIGFEGGEVAA